jgi:hypothetical protein
LIDGAKNLSREQTLVELMNCQEQTNHAVSPITVQAIPDGADNINGLLTALLRNVSTEDVRAHQSAQLSQRKMKSRGSWIRAVWLFF